MRIPSGRTICFFFVYCTFAFNLFLFSQSSYKRLSTNDGLAQNFVSSIVQDSSGFLWFGTFDGLSRYDGYSFKNFRNDPSDSLSLSPGFITSLHVSTTGIIWIGFFDGTVNLFDPFTERFVRIELPMTSIQMWDNRRITAIVEAPSGEHWIGSGGEGLFLIAEDRAQSGEFRIKQYLKLIAGSDTIETKDIHSLFIDRKGSLWVQTEERTVAIDPSGSNDVHGSPLNIMSAHGSLYNGIDQDSYGRMWFVSVEGIVMVDPAKGMDRTTVIPTVRKGKTGHDDDFFSLRYDEKSGSIWALKQFYIFRIDQNDTKKIVRIPSPLSANGLEVDLSMSFIDRSGVVWFGTKGFGVYQHIQKKESFGLLPGLNLTSLKRQFNRLSLPAGNGLTRFPEEVRDYFGAYTFIDSHGALWSEGVDEAQLPVMRRYDTAKKTLTMFHHGFAPRQLNGPYYPAFLEQRDGTLWIVNFVRGLDRFNAATGTFEHYQIVDGALKRVVSIDPEMEEPTTGVIDAGGSIWIGTQNNGLYHLDPASLSLKNYSFNASDPASISHNYVITICIDPIEPERFLWVGSYGGGLNRLDRSTGKFLRFNERTGLPSNVINSIRPDRHGFLWISSNHGLWKLDPRTLRFRFFDINDGLQGLEFNRFESYTAPDGKIFFGGTEGVNAFYPDRITENRHVPPVVFTDLKIKNRTVDHREEGSPLSLSISGTKSLTLRYSENVVTFEFAALDFVNPGKNEYSYRLQGFESEWSVPSTRRTATYTNLDPGDYIFTVKGSNGDGVWNQGGTSLAITVLPPWYRTWWAYAFYVIASVVILFFVRQYELKRIRLKDELVLEQSRSEQLKDVDQMKMRFFQNISHEFRTPLTLILGPLEKLIARSSDETDKRDFRMIRKNANRLLRLINQLLDISKLESGGMNLSVAQEDIVAFVRGITMSFHSLAERKEIFLDVHSEPQRIMVYVDKDKLEKILVNLIGNAFKFTPENGEVRVVVSVRGDAEQQKGLVDIAVRDTGIGIPPEKLGHIFDRFYQVDTSSTRSHEGTGIGLSLVKELIEIHKGTIIADSKPGEGTVFTISLPLGKDHLQTSEIMNGDIHLPMGEVYAQSEVDPPEIMDPELSPPAGEQDENIPMLLIIEDNYDVREYVKSYIVPHYRVMEAFDGEEGIRKAKEHIPDLIISDVMMPKKDGYEVCNAVKKDEATSHIPVILLTAKAASEDKISGLEIGADDYLVKPFDSAELLVRVKNLIENRRRLREKFGMEVVALKPDEVTVTPTEQLFLNKVKAIIEKKMGDENFDVEQLASAVNMSYTQLHRKLKAVIDQSANQFIRTMRLHRAMDILQQNGATISETAYSVGFSSPAYFTKCFTEQFGIPPSGVKKSL